MTQHNVMIVEGFRSPHEVVNNSQLSFEDKLRILEKWNQILSIKSQVFPNQSGVLNTNRKEVIELVNQLVKENMHLQDPELLFD